MIIPSINEGHLESLTTINEILQKTFFNPHNGKFRYEIWKPGDQYISFNSEYLNNWLKEALKTYSLN